MSLPRISEVTVPTHVVGVLEWGDSDAPLVVALHGFPDTAWTFRFLGPYLAERGWRVAAPFLRGYAPSGIPSDGDYRVGALTADAVAVHAALGGDDRSVVVGHDWGAIIANALGADPASPFAKAVAMAVPPLPTMNPGRGLWRPWLGAVARQPRNSWYILANQVPGVSERLFARLASRLWHDWSPGYDARTDLAFLLESVPDVERARAVLSYYRAAARPSGIRSLKAGMPLVATLFLQGERDGCLDRRFFPLVSARLTGSSSALLVPDAGHFLHVEQPAVVNARVADFLSAPGSLPG